MKKTNDEALSDVLKQMVKVFKLGDNLNKTKIQSIWSNQMGKTIASYTRELRVNQGILYVTIESAPLRSELHFGREKIKTMLNESLGEEYLREVVIQ